MPFLVSYHQKQFMKKRFFVSLLATIPIISFAQHRGKGVYAELGGQSIVLSVNYDTRLLQSNKGFGMRAGVGTVFDPYSFGFTVPVGLNYLLGKDRNFLELGVGATYVHFQDKNQDSWFNFRKENFVATNTWVGYRYQPPQKGVTFRAGICPFFTDLNLPPVASSSIWAGVSFGCSLR
jgi:hypothetical protein